MVWLLGYKPMAIASFFVGPGAMIRRSQVKRKGGVSSGFRVEIGLKARLKLGRCVYVVRGTACEAADLVVGYPV